MACALVTGVWSSSPAIARAQDPPKEPPPALEVSAQLSLLATTGNASSQSLGVGAELVWRPQIWTINAKAAFAQNRADDELRARATVGAFRASRLLRPRLSLFGDYGFLRDEFAGIAERHTIAGGLGYKLIDRAAHQLTIDGGAGGQFEDRLVDDSERLAIATGGARYEWTFSATGKLADDLRYVQDLGDGGNWKIDQSVSLTAGLTSVLSLKVSNIVRYVNEPVPGFESTDTMTSAALVWTLKRPARPAP